MVEFYQMSFIFQHFPCGPHTSFIVVAALNWCSSSHPDPQKKCFFLNYSKWGTANSLIVPNQENIEGDRPVQRHSHGQQHCNHIRVCRIIVQMNQDFLRYSFEFSGLLRNVSSTTFELPIQCWFIGKGPM